MICLLVTLLQVFRHHQLLNNEIFELSTNEVSDLSILFEFLDIKFLSMLTKLAMQDGIDLGK